MGRVKLALKPTTLRAANDFVAAHHRHHRPVRGCVSVVSVVDGRGKVRGVAILGRPLARALQDGATCEVLRVCTDGAENACSMLYGALARAAKALGYRRILTYTLTSEPGASLRASGFTLAATTRPRKGWGNRPEHGARDEPQAAKCRWEREL